MGISTFTSKEFIFVAGYLRLAMLSGVWYAAVVLFFCVHFGNSTDNRHEIRMAWHFRIPWNVSTAQDGSWSYEVSSRRIASSPNLLPDMSVIYSIYIYIPYMIEPLVSSIGSLAVYICVYTDSEHFLTRHISTSSYLVPADDSLNLIHGYLLSLLYPPVYDGI